MVEASWRAIAAASLAVVVLTCAVVMPAAAAPPPSAQFASTDAMLRWINTYRHKPDPDSLPAVLRALSDLQAFKDTETSGAYIGFIAGVIGANPARAAALIANMLPITPADHWVLVRAIAYSGASNWKELLATFVDRMPMRRAMIDKYLDGKLPTLNQIAYRPVKPGMLDKIKLLPLANDKENVDNLTTGSAAKFTLASNAVRDLDLLAMLKWAVKNQPKDVALVLNDVIETAETVDTARMRKESLAAIDELKQKGPNSKRELTGLGQIGQGALSMGCVVAAATGQIELGIPCVIGGAAYSAGLQYMSH